MVHRPVRERLPGAEHPEPPRLFEAFPVPVFRPELHHVRFAGRHMQDGVYARAAVHGDLMPLVVHGHFVAVDSSHLLLTHLSTRSASIRTCSLVGSSSSRMTCPAGSSTVTRACRRVWIGRLGRYSSSVMIDPVRSGCR